MSSAWQKVGGHQWQRGRLQQGSSSRERHEDANNLPRRKRAMDVFNLWCYCTMKNKIHSTPTYQIRVMIYVVVEGRTFFPLISTISVTTTSFLHPNPCSCVNLFRICEWIRWLWLKNEYLFQNVAVHWHKNWHYIMVKKAGVWSCLLKG